MRTELFKSKTAYSDNCGFTVENCDDIQLEQLFVDRG